MSPSEVPFEEPLETLRLRIEELEGYPEGSGHDRELTSLRGDLARMYLTTIIAGDPSSSLKEFRSIESRNKLISLPQSITFFHFVSESNEAIATARALQARQWTSLTAWHSPFLDFLTGRGSVSANDVVRAAGDSKIRQGEAHYTIGMKLLADGFRLEVSDHFRKSVAAQLGLFTEAQWSHTFLTLLAADPTWPPWIPVNPPADE